MLTYVNGEIRLNEAYQHQSGVCGEFGFCHSYFDTVDYIDNIKAYKIEDLTGGNVFIKNVFKKADGGLTGTAYVVDYDKAVTGTSQLITAIYDEDNKLLGVSLTEAGDVPEAGKPIDFTVDCSAEQTEKIDTVRCFWWNDVNTMQTLAESASIEIN